MTISNQLFQAGKNLEDYIAHPARMDVHPLYAGLARHAARPPIARMSAAEEAHATQQGWYLTPDQMRVESPPQFMALDGTLIIKGIEGYRNPYGETGLDGPGVLGTGWTHESQPIPETRAVDVVIQFIDPADGKLKIIGGFRTDTGQPCFLGGFVEKGKEPLTTGVREFFEEGVSGSLNLATLAPELHSLCEKRRKGHPLSAGDAGILRGYNMDSGHFSGDEGEAIYGLIEKEDPDFLRDLADFFKQNLTEAFKGPCRADPRNTNDRWIASTLLTGLIDLTEIYRLLQGRKFNYRLMAGSDLMAVSFHEFGPEFATKAYASQGPMACFATAHNLKNMGMVPKVVFAQCQATLVRIEEEIIKPVHPTEGKTSTARLRRFEGYNVSLK